MNREVLQQLANERLSEAALLLAAGKWSGAYYLSGYAVECGLKACVLHHIERTGFIFEDKKYAEKCWTHDLSMLVKLADLHTEWESLVDQYPTFKRRWGVVQDWSENARYQFIDQLRAREMVNAVEHSSEGILRWISQHW